MTTTADLAARLRAMPDDDLERLIVARGLPTAVLGETGPQSITDFFDLAEAFRADAAVDAAVERLPRRTLLALRDGTAGTDLAPAVALGLADHDGQVDDAVAARVAAHPDLTDLPGGPAAARHAGPVPDVADPDAARATGAEHAFATMTVLAELLRAVDDGGVRELVKGGIGSPLARVLAERSGSDAEVVPDRLGLLAHIRFTAPDEGTWTLTDAGRGWLTTAWPERWRDLVARWHDGLDPAVHEVLTTAGADWTDLVTLGRWAFPAGARWLDATLLDVGGTANALGVTVDGVVTDTGAALLGDDPDVAARAAQADLPQTVDGVYLQHDLTVIAPGPLAPATDAELRSVADLEAPGLAARYRVSDDSLRRALRAGRSRDDVLGLFERLGLTGVPQPLAYLVDEVAARDGSIVVDRAQDGLGAVVRGTPDQLDLIGVDAELRQMAWERPDLTTLVTRYPAHVVHAALEDQRYPAVLQPGARPETHHGPPGRRRVASRSPEAAARAVVGRLRLTTERGAAEPEQEWLGRQIDLAVRGRTPIRVVVKMPDGTERPFSIVPTSVAAGRVRGKDTTADVERTLPLSLVVSVDSEA
ncbi:helicase-associated domain-containing protein [Microbacterium sp. M1A1_1b]|uniref:helicase-associated domain-containing protein n=1 Tax=Curtobacterium sp. VKM Ac-2922 TaxID=2929475 RepID=UPI001FB386E3|nr:helicase-associated domain-containing protein [Curtobacterium sp. VKM Ac-2922]MCJ1714498.1 helicase-associated domain-containing protein [Curtobacterium sp. VKM Ac-2922]